MTKPSYLFVALLVTVLAGCGGGGGGGDTNVSAASVAVSQDGTAADGLAHFNEWRNRLGLTALVREARLDAAAQGHSDYQVLNGVISHYQTPGNPGFTGECMGDSTTNPYCAPTKVSRLEAAGYVFNQPAFAFGEVISRTAGTSGAAAAEALIAAIYHRFVIFEPMFKQVGAGAASAPGGSTYFTTKFAADGLDAGLGAGNVVVYPIDGQAGVARNFFSDQEQPDPWPCPKDLAGNCTAPNPNEVGYPISVHANATSVVQVTSFTVRPLGGALLQVRNLWQGQDPQMDKNASAAAILPRYVLDANRTYQVDFVGLVDGINANRTWTFTTGG